MKHSCQRIAAAIITLSMVVSSLALGTTVTSAASTVSGKTPIAAYDFTGGNLTDSSGKGQKAIVIDKETSSTTDKTRLNGNSGRATVSNSGITIKNGFFMLPDNLFSSVAEKDITGLTVSMTLTKLKCPEGWAEPWSEIMFSFSSEEKANLTSGNTNELAVSQRASSAFYMSYNGNVGTAKKPYSADGNWLDGAIGTTALLPYNEEHTVTLTYDIATNTATIYIDGRLAQSSIGSPWTVSAKLTAKEIKSFKANAIGRPTGGNYGQWGYGTYKDITIYTSALTGGEVGALVNGGWRAVAEYDSTPVLSGNGNGSFTVASMNVDGLPATIDITVLGFSAFQATLNDDGPGASGTTKIGEKIAAAGWDIVGFAEDFNYDDQLKAALGSKYSKYSAANAETIKSSIPYTELDSVIAGLPFDTDGLSLYGKSSVKVTENAKVAWTDSYSTNETYGGSYMGITISKTLPTGSGADGLITKGFRYFTAEVATGVKVDVYIMHMDAEDSAEDIAARANQIKQLAKYILNSNTKNPIIIMGDLNCRYTRDDLKTLLIDTLNADKRFTAQDAWVEYAWDGAYPAKGGQSLNGDNDWGDKGYPYPEAEIVDKMIYVNNTDSSIYLRLDSYKVDTSFKNADGTALADHWPIVGKFTYAKKQSYTVTYKDGAGGSVFADKVTKNVLTGDPTPAFSGGTPVRKGYIFDGWSPAVSSVVKGNATYTAKWVAESTSGSGTTSPGTTSPGTTTPGTTAPGGAATPGTTTPGGNATPGTTASGGADPGATDPGTDPSVSDSDVTDPSASDPGTTDSDVTGSNAQDTGTDEMEPDKIAPDETDQSVTDPDRDETATTTGDVETDGGCGSAVSGIGSIALALFAGFVLYDRRRREK